MALAPGFYDPKNVICVVLGVPITGFADGDDVIQAARNEDEFETLVGAMGDAIIIPKSDISGIITLKLLQSSPSNAALTAAMLLQRKAKKALPSFIKDPSSLTHVVASQFSVLAGPPPTTLGASHNPREWRVLCTDLSMTG